MVPIILGISPARFGSRFGLSEYAKFLLLINDIPLSLQYCSADFYADDATFHTPDKDIHTIKSRIQSTFNASKLWSTSNKMHIHYQKHPAWQ